MAGAGGHSISGSHATEHDFSVQCSKYLKLCHTCQSPYLSVLREVIIVIAALTSLLAPIVAQADPSLADFVSDVEDPSQAAALECVDWAALIDPWHPPEPRHGRMTNTCTHAVLCLMCALGMADTGCTCLCKSCACTLQYIKSSMWHT